MSILPILLQHAAAGRLFPVVPMRKGAKAVRRAYLTETARKDLNDPNSATVMLTGRPALQAVLENWVTGGHIVAIRKRPQTLKRLDPPPPEIWELRVTQPVHQARIFFRFAGPDCIVVTNANTRHLLGSLGSPEWAAAMSKSETEWQTLFGTEPPFSAPVISQYVSANCDDFSL